MSDNLYQNPDSGGSALGSLLFFGGWLGAEVAYSKMSGIVPEGMAATTLGKRRFLNLGTRREAFAAGTTQRGTMAQLAANKAKYERMGFIRKGWTRSRTAGMYSQEAWKAFLQPGMGWDLKARYGTAAKALEAMPGIKKGAAPVLRALGKAPLGFALGYLAWGSLIPSAVDLGLGVFQEASAEGARLRNRRPETVSVQYDTATRAQAFTMRQASAMAMHFSQTGLRASIGQEASFLH